MRQSDHPITEIVSASELFSRFITFATFDDKTAHECKELMLHRGEVFLKKLSEARNIIAKQGAQFVTDGCVSILPHAHAKPSTHDFSISRFLDFSTQSVASIGTCTIACCVGYTHTCRIVQ